MKDWLTPADFEDCPVWGYEEDADGYFVVRGLDDLPQRLRDLSILAQFTTPSGIQIRGEISGVDRVFAIGLFANDQVFFINKNLIKESREQGEAFLQASGLSGRLSYETLFPLRYETRWGSEVFNDFSGVFEMPS